MLQDKENLTTLTEISAHITVVVYNPETGVGEQIIGATALDFEKNMVSYIDLKTKEKKTATGYISLFVDIESLSMFNPKALP